MTCLPKPNKKLDKPDRPYAHDVDNRRLTWTTQSRAFVYGQRLLCAYAIINLTPNPVRGLCI